MSFLADFDDILEERSPLAASTTLAIGGPAGYLASPRSVAELLELLAVCEEAGHEVRMLGAGSNLLVADEGVAGVVVRLAGREFASLELLPGAIRCGAGLSLGKLVREAAAAGLSGLEGLAGIPASVGGALRMNAGGSYGAIGNTVSGVRVIGEGGSEIELSASESGFAYRDSGLAGLVITGCTLELTPEQPGVVQERTRQVLKEKRCSQPLKEKSAGCIFKNPEAEISAGRLLDELGFRGRMVGGAMVSDMHANYIINAGEASCSEVLELIDLMREAARRERGVELELEVEIWS